MAQTHSEIGKAGAGRAPAVTYKSLGLNVLLNLIPENAPLAVLDLGAPLRVNVDFWSRYPCRLHIRDLHRDYSAQDAALAETGRDAFFSGLLSFDPDTRFDVVLVWDLFNYMTLEEIGSMIGSLTTWCKTGTMIFALVSSQPQIPAAPNVFRIIDSEQIAYEARTPETRPCPRHQPRDLARLLAKFDSSHSFLLRNGIQEYIFACK